MDGKSTATTTNNYNNNNARKYDYNYNVHGLISQSEHSWWRPWLPSLVKMVRSWRGHSKINTRYQARFYELCKPGTPVAKAFFLRKDKTSLSFAISQCSRVLRYADDVTHYVHRLKSLWTAILRPAISPSKSFLAAEPRDPGKARRDGKASALKIRHEKASVASALECSLTGDPLILIAYPQTTSEKRDKMHSFVLKTISP